jgi:uncharacterized radical SAM protein YgiQ
MPRRQPPAIAPAPFLPMSQQEMDALGWDACDVILVTGDAYVDHPAFGAALLGRLLESRGWRVGLIAQPRWQDPADFQALGRPRLCFGITAGNVDSMIANLSAGKQRRRTDDFSPGGQAGRRPDRASIVYANRAREAYPGVPIVLGGLEASLRRLAHYDYWDDRVRRSLLLDARADILVYGMGEQPLLEILQRLAQPDADLAGIRGTVTIAAGAPDGAVLLPGFDEVSADRQRYLEAFGLAEREQAPGDAARWSSRTATAWWSSGRPPRRWRSATSTPSTPCRSAAPGTPATTPRAACPRSRRCAPRSPRTAAAAAIARSAPSPRTRDAS